MNTAQLKAISVVVALLLIVWGASEMVSRRPEKTTATLRLPPLAARDVDTITIAHGTDTVMLARQSPASWAVNGFAAATPEVDGLLQALRDSAASELVAQSPSSFARMGVDSGNGRIVRVAGRGKTLTTLIIAGHGPEVGAFYLRLPGDTHVYLWHGPLATLVGRPTDDWRDHTVAAVPPDSIAEVEIRRGATRFVLRKQGARWTLPEGVPADSAAAARLVEAYRTVTASGFATPRQADSLRSARARRSVVVRGPGRRELLALAFDSTAAGFWVRQGSTVYRLDPWRVNQLTPGAEAFKPASRAH
jgi:Domain of unknown function (DUF4340)